MEARTKSPNPRTTGIASTPPAHDLDAMAARSAGEVLGALRISASQSTSQSEGRVPVGMWKTGWLAQPEGAAS